MSKSDRRRVELHTHSTASDGELAPVELAELCARRGVELWGLTDHDTCQGCRKARAAAEKRGIEFLAGIEISAYLGRSIHLLGYGIAPEAPAIEQMSERLRRARLERMERMLERLDAEGLEVSMEAVDREADGAPLSRSHLADVLVENGCVDDRDEAFDEWIGRDGPAYVPVGWPSVPEAIERVHRAGGAAILAHPGRYEVDARIPRWVEAGLDGLEVGHPDHSRVDEAHYREMARAHGLVATESSDFHGRDDGSRQVFGETSLPVECLEALYEAIAQYR